MKKHEKHGAHWLEKMEAAVDAFACDRCDEGSLESYSHGGQVFLGRELCDECNGEILKDEVDCPDCGTALAHAEPWTWEPGNNPNGYPVVRCLECHEEVGS